MKFYRVRYHTDHGSSAGFKWFSSSREAHQDAVNYDKENPKEEPCTVALIEIHPSKDAILRALNFHASHPDNG